MVDERFIAAWAERLAGDIPGAVAVLLKGSHLRGNAGPFSDVDFDVLVDGTEIVDPYLSWIEPDAAGRLVHVSVAVEPLTEWLAVPDEAASWSFGLPSRQVQRLLWCARTDLASVLERADLAAPAGDIELEDFIEELGKARNAHLRGDELSMRLAAQEVAWLAPSVLRPVNPPVVAGTRPEALRLALDLPVVPDGYRADMLVCLGLHGQATTPDEVLAAAERLVLGIVALLRARLAEVAADLPPDWPRLVADGTLDRYLAQGT